METLHLVACLHVLFYKARMMTAGFIIAVVFMATFGYYRIKFNFLQLMCKTLNNITLLPAHIGLFIARLCYLRSPCEKLTCPLPFLPNIIPSLQRNIAFLNRNP